MSDSDHDADKNTISFADEKEILAVAKKEGVPVTSVDRKPTVILHTDEQQQQQNGNDDKESHVKAEDIQETLHINTNDEFISIENIRLFYLEDIPLDKLVNCTELEVRKNLIHDMIPFPATLRKQLVKLDLFDNKIKHIAPYFSAAGHPLFEDPRWKARYPEVTDLTFPVLRTLDLSYNQIKHISGLEALGNTLEELFLVENRIKDIENISHLKKLRLLELGGNQLRSITTKSLEGLTELEELWVGKNKINTLEPGCFAHCPKLRLLSLQANRLTDIVPGVFTSPNGEGIPTNLEQLHLSENGLKCIHNIGPLKKMQIMDFSFNPIPTLYHTNTTPAPAVAAAVAAEGEEKEETSSTTTTAVAAAVAAPTTSSNKTSELTFENFPELEEFWLTDAKVSDWKEISIFSPFEKTLTTIYLERTPLEDDRRYRDKIFQTLPFLSQIDSWPIVNKSNPEADRAIHRR